MQEETIQQLDDAVSEVFSMMLNRSCRPARCRVDLGSPPAALPVLPQRSAGCVSAEVRFSGSMRGTCSIHLAQHSAEVITGQLLGEQAPGQDSMTEDATGELCNIIAGSWKSRQPAAGSACSISSPRVESGQPCGASDQANNTHESVTRTYRFEEHCLRLDLTVK